MAEFHGPSDREAAKYLRERGFTLRRSMCWTVPQDFQFCEKDFRALTFLVEQWDYGDVHYEPMIPRNRRH